MAKSKGGNFRRSPASRQPKKIIYVFTEGAVTEPEYLNDFSRNLGGKSASVLKIFPAAGVPHTIVQKCLALRRELCSRRTYSLGPQDEIWAAFDVDEHPRILESYNLALKSGVGVAVSNPCIELWGLLHYGEVNAPLSRQEAQRKLRDLMPGYDHHTNARFPWGECSEKYEVAIANAQKGRGQRLAEGSIFPNDCPSSSFDLLLAVFL